MASATSPFGSDDFVMLDTQSQRDLAIDHGLSEGEAEQESDSLITDDDDLQHIQSPDSVRSLDTISNSPSETDDLVLVSCQTLPSTSSTSTSEQQRQKNAQNERESLSQTKRDTPIEASTVLSTHSPTPSLLLPTCHNHVTIDQQVMDLLIEHALTTHIEEEHGQGSANDARLRQQMMSRFRSLPANHRLLQRSMSQTHGSKALFPGQRRTVAEHEAIYHNVFNDVERMALVFFAECHVRHFEVACQFSGSFMPCGRDASYQVMQQTGAKEAKALALEIQAVILGRLDADRAFKDPFDDLRRQTRLQIDRSTSGPPRNNHAVSAYRFRSIELRRIFHTTLSNLPNTHYSPDDSVNRGFTSALKREQPEDEVEEGLAVQHLPMKKPTSATHSTGANTYQRRKSQWEPKDFLTPLTTNAAHPDYLRYLPDPRTNFSDASAKALQEITSNIQQMHFQERLVRSQTEDSKDREPFQLPYQVSLLALAEMNRLALANARREQAMMASGKSPVPEVVRSQRPQPVLEVEPALLPVGDLSITFGSLNCDNGDGPLSEHEKTWIREYAVVNAQSISAARTAKLVEVMMYDCDVYRHVRRNRLDPTEYYFRMEALLQVKSMKFLSRHNTLQQRGAKTFSFDHFPDNTAAKISQTPTAQSPGSQAEDNKSAIQSHAEQLAILEQQRREKVTTARNATESWPTTNLQKARLNPQSGVALSSIEGSNRKYRRDTLLAPSTSLPLHTSARSGDTLSSGHPVLSFIDEDSEGDVVRLASRSSKPAYTFAPARRLQETFAKQANHQEPRRLPEDNKEEEATIRIPDGATNLDGSSPTTISAPVPAAEGLPIRSRPLQTNSDSAGDEHRSMTNNIASLPAEQTSDYQSQLALLLKQNAARLATRKRQGLEHISNAAEVRDDVGQREVTTRETSESRTLPAVVERGGVTWIAFEYISSGVNMEYCIRTDVGTVGVDPGSSKDLLGIALAELNPCLRSKGNDLILTAVNHYSDTLMDPSARPSSSRVPAPINRSGQSWSGNSTNVIGDPFVIQEPDEIMADADLHGVNGDDESSSESDEEDEEDDEFFDTGSPPSFPKPFVDIHGTRHITFEHSSCPSFTPTYYTIRADTSSVSVSGDRRVPETEQCLCSIIQRQGAHQHLKHTEECDIGLALSELNPILKGRENRKLLESATAGFFMVRDHIGWHRAKSQEQESAAGGSGKINPIVPEVDVANGFVDFSGSGDQEGMVQAQCLYCNLILNEPSFDTKVFHYRSCSIYGKKKGFF